MKPIPILDLQPQLAPLWPELEKAALEVLRSGQFIGGSQVEQFEREVAAYVGTKHAIGLGSGTDALVIGLRALGIGPGDEVIVPSFTFFATAETVSTVGATPVFADIEPGSFCLDPEDVRRKLTKQTRAIVPVHLYGHVADMDTLSALAAEHDLAVLEDAAQAIGARRGSRPAGSFGGAAAFSFYPSKNLGAFGDGGLVVTQDAELAERVRVLRNHGSPGGYVHQELGYCSRLDAMQAALLLVKLPHLERWNDERRAIAARYSAAFNELPEVEAPPVAHGTTHVFHQYTVRLPEARRDSVRTALESAGVRSVIYYPVPIHQMAPYAGSSASLPETERACREVLSLPIFPGLEQTAVDRVIAAVRSAFA